MKKIFDEVQSLDRRAIEKYFLSEDVLMENAALSIFNFIKKNFKKNSSVLIVCGSGNNGADGLALARLLQNSYKVKVLQHIKVKSPMAIIQEKRAKALGVEFVTKLEKCDILVDAIFGTGLYKDISFEAKALLEEMNKLDAYKIACDIPSGINKDGLIKEICFKANTTITMGAYKTSLFGDLVKDFVGKIKVGNLGIHSDFFQTSSNKFLLQKSDLKLPNRESKNSNKGSFGHLNIICGEKEGASIISSEAAFVFGVGLVTVISKNKILRPSFLMQSEDFSKNCTTVAFGMGLGFIEDSLIDKIVALKLPKLLDADIFYNKRVLEFLEQDCVLTPHPKEFISLLKLTNLADITIKELQVRRFFYVEKFTQKYPNVTILLKGANVIIAQNSQIFVNIFGSSKLSKGGSGDVLSGLIASLLAQGYSSLDAAISGSLAHTLSAKHYKKRSYSMTPKDIIEGVKTL
ncbi:bifunctional ADP-dependent NAD(P)H-hydrate dehydratase/NAD(P)H-hydrate epimerase [Arcobacter sp. AHV-9/2010]|uniref:NAD(P)H-hydrate dehydratase n=1 Tax=Arcobacter sp. AHV-9/2010 TaxID=2021861 RepID=UPI00100B280C|nr:NAD(P)H-hydrate dehydratase [Arcobacter sp. CECT 9299]RXJ97039.1 bifunctional ADP-dependent NAD(P)H-hydrate dehydratase/NAD(P)H-hydrate epimerase [Arcobacter sp. CECT 9299]